MGLMTLISSKFHSDKKQPQPRALPYERKISPRSPVRIVRNVPAEDEGAPAPTVHIYRDEGRDQPAVPKSTSRRDFSLSNKHGRSSLRDSTLNFFKLSWSGRASRTASSSGRVTAISSNLPSSVANTEGGRRGHVDLLDAQSEYSHANFRGRVNASGAREFGEDVADRNLSPRPDSRAQSFYSSHVRTPIWGLGRQSLISPTNPLREVDENRLSRHGAPIDADIWHSDMPSFPAAPSAHRAMRHRSLNATQSAHLTNAFNALHTGKHRRHHSLDEEPTPDSSSGPEMGSGDVPGLLSAWDTSSSETDGTDREDEPLPLISVNNTPILSPKPKSFRVSAAMASPRFTSPSRHSSSSRRNSIQSAKAPPSLHAQDSVPDLSSLPHHLKERMRHFKESWPRDAMVENWASAPSPSIKANRPSSRSRDFDRFRGGLSTPPRSRQSMLVPGSAVRHGSMTSSTPTMSSSSSAFCARPQSYHTANTSADFTSIALASLLSSSLSCDNMRQESWQDANRTILLPPAVDMDEASDSDDDSFIGVRRQSRCEEKLLFENNYGGDGLSLPGLPVPGSQLSGLASGRASSELDDDFAAPAPVVMLHNPRLSVFASAEDLQLAYHNSSEPEEGYEQAVSSDILSSTGTPPPREPTPVCLSPSISVTYEPIYEEERPASSHQPEESVDEAKEKPGKIDISLAIRLRKEAKSRKRASLVSIMSDGRFHALAKTIGRDEPQRPRSVDGVA